MKPALLVCSLLLSANAVKAHDNAAEICAGAAAIAAPIIESSEKMNSGLGVIRLTGSPRDSEAAAELHRLSLETMRKMTAAMAHVADLCETRN